MQNLSIKDWANKVISLNAERPKVLSEAKSPVEAMKFSLMNANLIFKFETAVAMLRYKICEELNISPQTKISVFKTKKEVKDFSEKYITPKCKSTNRP